MGHFYQFLFQVDSVVKKVYFQENICLYTYKQCLEREAGTKMFAIVKGNAYGPTFFF